MEQNAPSDVKFSTLWDKKIHHHIHKSPTLHLHVLLTLTSGYRVIVRKYQDGRPLEKLRHEYEDNIKMDS
jgi:hypothetical protein